MDLRGVIWEPLDFKLASPGPAGKETQLGFFLQFSGIQNQEFPEKALEKPGNHLVITKKDLFFAKKHQICNFSALFLRENSFLLKLIKLRLYSKTYFFLTNMACSGMPHDTEDPLKFQVCSKTPQIKTNSKNKMLEPVRTPMAQLFFYKPLIEDPHIFYVFMLGHLLYFAGLLKNMLQKQPPPQAHRSMKKPRLFFSRFLGFWGPTIFDPKHCSQWKCIFPPPSTPKLGSQ